jgi:ribosomal subunit interface protein
MKISLSCKHAELRQAVEDEVARLAPKIEKLLKRYSPDLVLLHGSFEKQPRKSEHHFALNLSLPTGTLHSIGTAVEVRASIHQAFTELAAQLKKHKSKVRHDYEWKRKRGKPERAVPDEAPAAD